MRAAHADAAKINSPVYIFHVDMICVRVYASPHAEARSAANPGKDAVLTDLTVERVRQVLDYDPETGIFTWIVRLSNRACEGHATKGSLDGKGYYRLMIDRRTYQAHRIAWLHAYGVWPTMVIDHIDRDPANNRLSNLRDVSYAVNSTNCSPSHGGHARDTDARGCTFVARTQRWQAQISINGVNKYLGYFKELADARAAYKRAKLEHEQSTDAKFAALRAALA